MSAQENTKEVKKSLILNAFVEMCKSLLASASDVAY
jgi:hypothetical protein